MSEPYKFKCEDCPAHSVTRKDVDTLLVTVNELKKQWDEHNQFAIEASADFQRRLGEKIPIRHGIFALGIVISIFTTIIGFNISYNSRVADNLEYMLVEMTKVKVTVEERQAHDRNMQQLLDIVKEFKEQERVQDYDHLHRSN